MGRRKSSARNISGKSKMDGKVSLRSFNYHEGLSVNQVKIILYEFGLYDKLDEFNEWMYGQTCPIIKRGGEYDIWKSVPGIYEWDLFRWIAAKKKGTEPVWD